MLIFETSTSLSFCTLCVQRVQNGVYKEGVYKGAITELSILNADDRSILFPGLTQAPLKRRPLSIHKEIVSHRALRGGQPFRTHGGHLSGWPRDTGWHVSYVHLGSSSHSPEDQEQRSWQASGRSCPGHHGLKTPISCLSQLIGPTKAQPESLKKVALITSLASDSVSSVTNPSVTKCHLVGVTNPAGRQQGCSTGNANLPTLGNWNGTGFNFLWKSSPTRKFHRQGESTRETSVFMLWNLNQFKYKLLSFFVITRMK